MIVALEITVDGVVLFPLAREYAGQHHHRHAALYQREMIRPAEILLHGRIVEQFPPLRPGDIPDDRVKRGQAPADDAQLRPARSEEHTSELQSLIRISYAVFCL